MSPQATRRRGAVLDLGGIAPPNNVPSLPRHQAEAAWAERQGSHTWGAPIPASWAALIAPEPAPSRGAEALIGGAVGLVGFGRSIALRTTRRARRIALEAITVLSHIAGAAGVGHLTGPGLIASICRLLTVAGLFVFICRAGWWLTKWGAPTGDGR